MSAFKAVIIVLGLVDLRGTRWGFRMSRQIHACFLVLALCITSAWTTYASSSRKSRLTPVTVDVFNDAGVASPVLKGAELEAERIFDASLKDNRQVPPKKVTQRFICDIGYSQKKCDQQMSILRK